MTQESTTGAAEGNASAVVLNLNRPTFFSAARRMVWENPERTGFVCGGRGNGL